MEINTNNEITNTEAYDNTESKKVVQKEIFEYKIKIAVNLNVSNSRRREYLSSKMKMTQIGWKNGWTYSEKDSKFSGSLIQLKADK